MSSAYLRGFPGWLRRIADRLDPAGAPRALGHSFTFELNEGIRFRDDNRGCPMWYLGEPDYRRAHEESDRPGPWMDWSTMTLRRNGDGSAPNASAP